MEMKYKTGHQLFIAQMIKKNRLRNKSSNRESCFFAMVIHKALNYALIIRTTKYRSSFAKVKQFSDVRFTVEYLRCRFIFGSKF